MPITFLFWLRSSICLPIQRTLTYDPHMKVPQGIVSFAQAMIAVKKATVRKFLRSSKLVILLRKILFLSFLFSRVLIFSREFYSLRGAKSRGVKKPFYSLKLALRKRFQLFPHWKEAHHIRPLSFFIHTEVLSFAKDTHSDKNTFSEQLLLLLTLHEGRVK